MPARSTTQTLAPAKAVDEKITVNLGCVDLGQIDLLVQEGFYANRTDLIRTAIRNQIASHGEAVRQAVTRRTLVLGIQHYTAADLQTVLDAGETLDIRVLGLASFDANVTPALALATIAFVEILRVVSLNLEITGGAIGMLSGCAAG